MMSCERCRENTHSYRPGHHTYSAAYAICGLGIAASQRDSCSSSWMTWHRVSASDLSDGAAARRPIRKDLAVEFPALCDDRDVVMNYPDAGSTPGGSPGAPAASARS